MRPVEAASSRRLRRGAETLELILALPILLLVALAGLQFCLVLSVEQTLRAATNEAAREAAKGASDAETVSIVESHLATHGIPGLTANSGARIWIDRQGLGTDAAYGDASVASTIATNEAAAGEVRIILAAKYEALPTPDLLASFGLTFMGALVEESSLIRVE